MQRIYLDHAATTAPRPEVIEAMLPFYRMEFANPSSPHSSGQRVRRALEAARERTAAGLGAKASEIVFTSGGSESDCLAIFGIAEAYAQRGRHLVISAIEHHAVLHAAQALGARGADVTLLPVDREGLVSPDNLRAALRDQTVLVSIMHANNEIGTLQRIPELAEIAHEREAFFHTDAVQTVGHVPVDVRSLGVDALSLSGHKFEGPKGVGALYVRNGIQLSRIFHGGGQEAGRRSGTENVPAIVGLAAALDLALRELPASAERTARLRDRLIDGILETIPGSNVNGPRDARLPNNASLRFEQIEAHTVVMSLDLLGIEASTGSACSSGSLAPSHVLTAIGLHASSARGTVRFSLGTATQAADVDCLLSLLPGIIQRLRRLADVLVVTG